MTGCSRTTSIGFHTDALAQQLPSLLRDLLAPSATSSRTARARPAALARQRPSDLRRPGRVRGAGAERGGARGRAELVERRPEQLVVRVDRTDPSKNIVRGFRAFELYLEAQPEVHGRVGMLALLDPSRQDIPEYSEYLAAIQREARRVNDRFQRGGWMPIELRSRTTSRLRSPPTSSSTSCFVNAIFDGMNLVAKEAPLVNERDGVVVLSENTGAYEELQDWVVRVNPFDVAGQAEALSRALAMSPAKRHERLEAIRAHVREHDIAGWIEGQLADLDRCVAGRRVAIAFRA